MKEDIYSKIVPVVEANPKIRHPQKRTFKALSDFASESDREAGIVLPVGCGKSGCIALAPFAFKSKRALVIAPGTSIAGQLFDDFSPTSAKFFLGKVGALNAPPYPEPAEIRGADSNRADLDDADVVVTNIQQLQGDDNRWLKALPDDYFDLIIFDEGHHSVAPTWEALKRKFASAKIVNFSATPQRSDGQIMTGKVLYSYPVADAIKNGYVKHLKGLVLNPRTLKYVRREDGEEIEVSLDEVRRLGESESDFRHSIVTSKETLETVVDASIRELQRIRSETGETRHKIIASALNQEHCRQVVLAYQSRGMRAGYVHSLRDGEGNKSVMRDLESHQLDVIVQVRKLGEGFDHPYLSVAAVLSIFSNLAPFVQFVGRIMRVIIQDSPGNPMNQGTVVFHAGSNVASRWEDFQEFSKADQEYFQALLPLESLDFEEGEFKEIVPAGVREENTVEVRSQDAVSMRELPLLDDPAAAAALKSLIEGREALLQLGYTDQQIQDAVLTPVPVMKQAARRAEREALETRTKNETARILGKRNVEHHGKSLDRARRGRTNFVVLKAAIDKQINAELGVGTGQRAELSRQQIATIEASFDKIVAKAESEVFDG